MRILTVPGVFRPRSDSWLLADAVVEHGVEGRSVLDVFTGSGVVAARATAAGAGSVTAVDVSRRAALCARVNGWLNGGRVRALRGDLFEPVDGERFELISANPPYLPGPARRIRGAARAWEGGPGGRELLDRICREAHAHLTPAGTLLIVQSSVAGPERSLELLRDSGLDAEIAERRRGPFGPLLAARAELLERQQLIAPGQRQEEIILIAASARG